jgi:hypothetical protein
MGGSERGLSCAVAESTLLVALEAGSAAFKAIFGNETALAAPIAVSAVDRIRLLSTTLTGRAQQPWGCCSFLVAHEHSIAIWRRLLTIVAQIERIAIQTWGLLPKRSNIGAPAPPGRNRAGRLADLSAEALAKAEAATRLFIAGERRITLR